MNSQTGDPGAVPAVRRTPRGPKALPLYGNLPEISRDRLGFLVRTAREYGAVSRFALGPIKMYGVYHPDGVKRVLQENHHNYSKKTPVFEQIRPLLGEGLFISEGEFWLRQRRLMSPAFHRQRVAGFAEMMSGVAAGTVESWSAAAKEGRAVDVAEEMMRLTLDVACRALFSADLRSEASAIGRAVDVMVEDFVFRFDHPLYPPPAIPTPRNRRRAAALAELDRVVYGLIAARRREGNQGRNDLLSMLLEARDEDTGEGMSDKQLRDELITLLIAGHETTANTLTWAFALLSQHPEAGRRAHAEVESALNGRLPAAADLPNLPYVRMVIDETLRLYPPAWVTNRVAVADDELCGFHVPAGTNISLSPYATQRLPEFWPNPEGFDPERFTPERSAGRPQFAYYPFGGGPRMCIGKGFALTEAPLVLATILQRCRLDLLPGRDVRKHPVITLRPAGGLPMTVHMR